VTVQFTAGPWDANIYRLSDDSICVAHIIATDGRASVAQIATHGEAETVANARLMAAAPELYEALAELHRACLGTPVGGGDGGTYAVGTPSAASLNKALAALAKARGEQVSA
jgi:hypothetical protein